MHLENINPSIIKKYFSFFWDNKSFFYMINIKGKEVGIFELNEISDKVCEIHLWIFKDFRYKLPYKGILKYLLDFPFNIGFNTIIMCAESKAIETYLMGCKRYGIIPYARINNLYWFYRHKEN